VRFILHAEGCVADCRINRATKGARGARATDLSLGGKPQPAPQTDKITARRPSIARTFNLLCFGTRDGTPSR
jgi:hypothetical protein